MVNRDFWLTPAGCEGCNKCLACGADLTGSNA